MKSINAEWRPGAAASLDPGTPRRLRIAVIGCGHLGLVTASCFAGFGHRVVAVDRDAARVARLSRSDLHDLYGMQEPALADQLTAQTAAQRLSFTTCAEEAVAGAHLVFVAVETSAQIDGSVDTRAVDDLAAPLSAVRNASAVIVIQSTVPAGTAQRVQARLDAQAGDMNTAPTVLVCPAFMRRGFAVADFLAPARILIGDDSCNDTERDTARSVLLEACAPMIEAGAAVLTMDTRSAELSNQAANAMLATRISFMNEIAAIASATGADIEKVREGVGSDRRIGMACLQPGPGYGGSSLPRDVAALRETARRHNLRADLLLATERVNDRQRCWAFSALRHDFGPLAELRGLRIAVWGLAFKPGTDDARNAPSVALVDRLVRAGVSVVLFDPVAMNSARSEIAPHRRIAWAASAEHALEGCDVMMLMTQWPQFVAFDPAVAGRALRMHTVYDCRNALDAQRWSDAGLRVVQVGRPLHRAGPLDSLMPTREKTQRRAREAERVEQPIPVRVPGRMASDPFGLAA